MLARIVFSIALGVSLSVQRPSLCAARDAMQREAAPATMQRVGAGASHAGAERPVETWRRIHSPGSSAGPEAGAILRIAVFERSDPRLAGLMLRCAEHGVEAIIIVIEPFPPHARPKITLRVAGQESYLEGDVIPTGAGVRLPVDGGKLATGPWRGSEELGIEISDGASTINGVVGLSGLTPALNALLADCTQR
jgi:hypothetical protein